MTVSAPYCESDDVWAMRAYLQDPTQKDFRSAGTPPKEKIDLLISQVSSRIDAAYASVGYVIPFTVYKTESWPSWQTSFLSYFNAIGVAAMLGSRSTQAPIALPSSRIRGTGNWFHDEYNDLVDGVKAIGRGDTGQALSMIRASVRAGSPADKMLSVRRPPLSDVIEGYRDPTRSDLMRDFTRRYREYFKNNNSQLAAIDSDPAQPDWLYWWHYRLGLTYES